MTLSQALQDALIRVAIASGDVANYCDHTEHSESADEADVLRAGLTLRESAIAIGAAAGINVHEAYADRIGAIESGNVYFSLDSVAGREKALRARSWWELQQVQVQHDKYYHPDVTGLSRNDQLRHYSFHLAKLGKALAEAQKGLDNWEDFARRRLPDMLLFGIKLSTVMREPLSKDPHDFPWSSVAA
jgi:hypothetical protein